MKLLMIGFKLAFSHFIFPRARSHFLFPVLATSVFKTTSQNLMTRQQLSTASFFAGFVYLCRD